MSARLLVIPFTVLVAIPAGSGVADDASDGDAVIEAFVEQLGAESFRDRAAASRELYEIGVPALPRLRLAMKHPDREVANRAARIVPRVMAEALRSRSTGMQFVLVDRGEFRMGSPATEKSRNADERPHAVRIERPFLVGAYEVSQLEFETVMKRNPSWFSSGGGGREKVAKISTSLLPVESVTWFDAIAFCNRLSRRDGLDPYYVVGNERKVDGVTVEATVHAVGGNGYRLPTEAEWEYACRAGTSTPTAVKGGNFKQVTTEVYGTRRTVGLGRTAPVNANNPNPWGLYNVHGNVDEWCFDWYAPYPDRDGPVVDPSGPDEGRHRVIRSGSWLLPVNRARSAARFWGDPATGPNHVGFRVARDPVDALIEHWPGRGE